MNARPPQRLVRVDVADPCDRTLVEQRRLDGRPAALEAAAELPRREPPLERLPPEPRAPVRIGLEAARRRMVEAAGHAQVDEEVTPAPEDDNQILPAPAHVEHLLAHERGGDVLRAFRPRKARVED